MGYDINDKIIGSQRNFNNLRAAINQLINTRKAAKGLGTSDFENYAPPASIITEINNTTQEVANNIIDDNPFVNGIKVIQDLLQKGYMKPMGTTAQQNAATRIKNANTYDEYSIIPALTDFFTVVNYWNNGTDGNSTGCNGACTGYCDGSCAQQSKQGTQSMHQDTIGDQTPGSCNDCDTVCIDNCSYGCGSNCTTACISKCYEGCITDCYDGCVDACRRECGAACLVACGTACAFGCSNNCTSNCGTGCATGCGTGCVNACYSTCNTTCSTSCTNTCSTSCTGSVGPITPGE